MPNVLFIVYNTYTMKTYVYWIRSKNHTNIATEGYVGVACNYEKRMSEHKRMVSGADRLYTAIKKYGWDELVKSIVCIADKEYCYEMEKKLRPSKRVGWNIAIGGGLPPDNTGRKHLASTLIKLSEGKKGDKNPAKRLEVRAKISASLSGDNSFNMDRTVYKFRHKLGDEFIGTRTQISEKYNLNPSHICEIVKGSRKSRDGWSYIGLA